MVELRHHQRLVWEGWFPEQAEGWWEEWMRQADQVLDDDERADKDARAVVKEHGGES
jgi:hypothetical protein